MVSEIDSDERRSVATSRPGVQSLTLAGLAIATTTLLLIRAALDRGQDWSFDSHSYHTAYAYASVFERGRLGYPMSLGAYFNPLLDLPLGWGVRQLGPKTITVGIVIVQSCALAAAAVLPWHCITGSVLPPSSGRWQITKTQSLWVATYGFSVIVAYGAFGRIQLGATWGDLTSALPAIIALHLLVRWTWTGSGRLLLTAGAMCGLAFSLKYTNGPNLLGGAVFVAFVAVHRTHRGQPILQRARDVRRFLAGCLAGIGVSLGPWALVLLYRFGNPVFPFGGRRFNDELVTTNGDYVDLGANDLTIRSFVEFVGEPVRLLKRSTAVTEFAVRDIRLFVGACCCVLLPVLSLRVRQVAATRSRAGRIPNFSEPVVLAIAFAAYWAMAYSAWAFLFGNGRYLQLIELLTPTMVCMVVVLAVHATSRPNPDSRAPDSLWRRNSLASSSASALACVAALAVPLTVSPDYGHQPFGRRWYDLDTSELPNLDDAMLIVPYESEPLDFAEFVLEPSAFVRLHAVLIPTGLGQREIERVVSFTGPIYSFQFTDGGDANLAAVGLHRTGRCYPVPTFQGFSYNLCELRRDS
jgi:hypothetical protein